MVPDNTGNEISDDRKSVNYLKFTISPIIEDNVMMIIKDVSDNLFNEIVTSTKTVEVIFEVSLN
jgi:hypothetical protein